MTEPKKLRVGLLFGGRSAEHDVSIMSARNVFDAIDRSRYDVVSIAISRSGRWILVDADGGLPQAAPDTGVEIVLLPGGGGRALILDLVRGAQPTEPIDVLFPVLHGPFGEDGSIQGYAETVGVAYVGSTVFGSAAAMDKDAAKRLLREAGLPVARSVVLDSSERLAFDAIEQQLGLPFFVKPASQGSSVGVSKVVDQASFQEALDLAFRHGDKLLVEEFVDGREIEFSVLERAGQLMVSSPGEIVAAAKHGFYTYEAKYIDADGARIQVPADIPRPVAETAKGLATRAFRALGCRDLARVDFFLRADMSLLINEVNTMPGFTDISMFAKALAADGMAYKEVVAILLANAVARRTI